MQAVVKSLLLALRLIVLTAPQASAFGYSSGNDVGRLHTVTDPRSIVSTYSYDSFGRVSQIQANDSSGSQLGVTRNYSYDKRGLLTELDQSYQSSAVGYPSTITRTYDGYGAIATELVTVTGVQLASWQQTHDAAGRRTGLTQLNFGTTPLGYTYRADGKLASSTFNGSTYSYNYGTDGLLASRATPWKTENIVSRDSVGRVTEQTQSVAGTTMLDEQLFWRGDSTLSGYQAKRTGTGAWNESRQYAYDVRGHVLSETYAPSATGSDVLNYHFDNDAAGGLGLRTAVALKGTDSGSNTQTTSNWARPYQQATTGLLNDPRGTPITDSFDAVGQMSTHNPSTGNDTLTWDAMGQLVKVSRRDTNNNGLDFWAIYDGLGRRCGVGTAAVTGGVDGPQTQISSEYDPEAEFLEVANTVNLNGTAARRWLVNGPDLNEQYGGLNGAGGLEAVVNTSGPTTTGIMSDGFGHAVASGSGATTNWSPVRSLGYGVQPGLTAQALDINHDVASAVAWRGKYIDPTGFYYLGARYYDPAAGTFLSCDPLGHAASMDLYSYCNGDPVNGFDPDGRLGSMYTQASDAAERGEDAAFQDYAMYSGSTYPFIKHEWSGLTAENYRQAGLSGATTGLSFSLGLVSGGSSNLVTIPGRIAVGSLVAGGANVVVTATEGLANGNPASINQMRDRGINGFYWGLTGATVGQAWKTALQMRATAAAEDTGSLWTKDSFNGTTVYQRNDLINPNLVDDLGRTNLQRMQSGIAPIGPDGESINLHHMLQTQDGPIAEMTQTFHQENSAVIHINPSTTPSGIDRNAFNAWKRGYWQDRANDFSP